MQVSELINTSRLIAAEGYFFCLDTKEAKDQVSKRGFFAAQGLYPAKHAEPRAAKSCPYIVPALPNASGQYCYAPAIAQGRHVLPAFTRSCFADRKKEIKSNNCCDEPNDTEQMRHRQKAASTGIATVERESILPKPRVFFLVLFLLRKKKKYIH